MIGELIMDKKSLLDDLIKNYKLKHNKSEALFAEASQYQTMMFNAAVLRSRMLMAILM
jgi:hypothetical protein